MGGNYEKRRIHVQTFLVIPNSQPPEGNTFAVCGALGEACTGAHGRVR